MTMSEASKPYVPAESTEREFTLKAVLAGIVMSGLFGAANAYLGMKAGMTIAATIPAAVIAIWLFRVPFYRGGVLEQNITRTAASVGEALVAGAIFTIPAFVLVEVEGRRLWADFRSHFWEATLILLAGGLLGVFFIIILRRPLCVESDLPFPESRASAEREGTEHRGILVASGFIAGEAITGILLAFVYLASGKSVTQLLTGTDQFSFLPAWGGPLSLIIFAMIAYGLIKVPVRNRVQKVN